ncbi:translation initiation factor IF-3 [bacterium]|nr:MAG: translation initiation factor IF-3 [bacterium]
MVDIQKFIRVNDRIRAPQVRLIGAQGEQLGIVPLQKALSMADQYELDLVEVAPGATPPVCRILDFTKYKYEEEKKERLAKKRQHQVHLKEIRVKPNIEEHDYQVKLRQLISFLQKKDKVKVGLFFRGREMAHQELGRRILDRFMAESTQYAIVEKPPTLEGRTISMIIGPK